MSQTVHGRRRRFVPAVLVGAALCAALLAASTTGTLSGFVASIQNTNDVAATGALTMQEQNSGATVTCTSNLGNTATCSTINKYGGSTGTNTTMVPGTPVSTTITIKNTGTVNASTFTLAPGACTQSTNGSTNGSATDLCSKINITMTQDGTSKLPANSTLATLASGSAIPLSTLAAGATSTFIFTITLQSSGSAATDNTYQGLQASQPLTWTFNS